MMQELLLWVHLNDLKVVAAQNVSNILIFLYVISYIFNKKAVFVMAFLLVEFYGNVSVFSVLSNVQYYIGYVFLYALSYWVVFKRYHMVKPLLGYGIMVLFQLGMALDAALYPDNETVISESYVYIVVAIHLYIIISSVRWQSLRLRMGDVLNSFRSIFCSSYSISFFWYTVRNLNQKTYSK